MPWPFSWPSYPQDASSLTTSEAINSARQQAQTIQAQAQETATSIKDKASAVTNDASTRSRLFHSFTQPSTLISTAILTTTVLSLFALQRRYLRRYPTATSLPQTYILPSTRRFTRSIFGHVTSVGDADNFRLFHTPFGRLGLWGILRKVPEDTKALKNNTIHIRLAGIDAPELAHFGRPAQLYSKEALEWLTSYLRGRRVRCYVHKADQYSRVVATVYIWKGLLRRDVGLQMLRAGFATVYESKSGAEFGGKELEQRYKDAEEMAKRRRRGMWKDGEKLESPREYKNKYREGGEGKG
ncbi:putative endonuclease lcl3 [Lithohypha guttulata]|uniref:Probable endonuclease LCL3 n=1 Tax=Lithohypha guttulata TaxID=1690604 RepID=A0AAN7T3T2_9EURO|nr:putative endonuclease lcl3 [Lithohypha guttulata]